MGLAFTAHFLGKKSCNKKILNAEQSRRACRNSTCALTRSASQTACLVKISPSVRGGLALCKLAIPGPPAFLLYPLSISCSPSTSRGISPHIMGGHSHC